MSLLQLDANIIGGILARHLDVADVLSLRLTCRRLCACAVRTPQWLLLQDINRVSQRCGTDVLALYLGAGAALLEAKLREDCVSGLTSAVSGMRISRLLKHEDVPSATLARMVGTLGQDCPPGLRILSAAAHSDPYCASSFISVRASLGPFHFKARKSNGQSRRMGFCGCHDVTIATVLVCAPWPLFRALAPEEMALPAELIDEQLLPHATLIHSQHRADAGSVLRVDTHMCEAIARHLAMTAPALERLLRWMCCLDDGSEMEPMPSSLFGCYALERGWEFLMVPPAVFPAAVRALSAASWSVFVQLCEKQLAATRHAVVRQDLIFVADFEPDFVDATVMPLIAIQSNVGHSWLLDWDMCEGYVSWARFRLDDVDFIVRLSEGVTLSDDEIMSIWADDEPWVSVGGDRGIELDLYVESAALPEPPCWPDALADLSKEELYAIVVTVARASVFDFYSTFSGIGLPSFVAANEPWYSHANMCGVASRAGEFGDPVLPDWLASESSEDGEDIDECIDEDSIGELVPCPDGFEGVSIARTASPPNFFALYTEVERKKFRINVDEYFPN